MEKGGVSNFIVVYIFVRDVPLLWLQCNYREHNPHSAQDLSDRDYHLQTIEKKEVYKRLIEVINKS